MSHLSRRERSRPALVTSLRYLTFAHPLLSRHPDGPGGPTPRRGPRQGPRYRRRRGQPHRPRRLLRTITSPGPAGRFRIPTTSASSSAAACRWRSTRCAGGPPRGASAVESGPGHDPGVHAGDVLPQCAHGPGRGGLWALAARRLRLRWLLGTIALVAVVAGLALLLTPQLVRGAFDQKSHVASANVDVRFGYYRVELDEFAHYPITGVGPGNFVYRFYQFAPPAGESRPAVSVRRADDQRGGGLPGDPGRTRSARAWRCSLATWRCRGPICGAGSQMTSGRISCRPPSPPASSSPCVGALFLTEQYYPPLWFLPAVAASLASGRPRAEAEGAGRSRHHGQHMGRRPSSPWPPVRPGGFRRRFGYVPAGPCPPAPQSPSSDGTGSIPRAAGLLYRPRFLPARWRSWPSTASSSPSCI